MGFVVITEKRSPRKSKTRAPAVESALPGLLAMARWAPRRLSIEHYALACGIGYLQASRNLARFRAKGLVSAIKTARPFATGQGVLMHGLTRAGHELLTESCEWEEEWVKPCSRVPHGDKFDHDHTGMAALVVAESEIDQNPDFSIVSRFAEFKWDTRPRGLGKFPTADYLADKVTRLKWDASLTAAKTQEAKAVPYLLEIDMGTELVIPEISEKFRKLWAYLAEDKFDQRLSGTSGMFYVLFITTSHRRIDNVIKKVNWESYAPIDGLTPADIFRLATHKEAIGVRKSSEKAAYGNFWGPVWRSCSGADRLCLIKPKTLDTAHSEGS